VEEFSDNQIRHIRSVCHEIIKTKDVITSEHCDSQHKITCIKVNEIKDQLQEVKRNMKWGIAVICIFVLTLMLNYARLEANKNLTKQELSYVHETLDELKDDIKGMK
jgi:hypothetical protein